MKPAGAGHRPRPENKEDTITELIEEHLEDEDADVELEDLEIEPLPQIDFEVGDNVVYPHHGAGKVLKKEMKDVLGEKREYLTIKILHNDMTVMVPTENAAVAGLRRVIDEETFQKVLAVLQDECSEMPKNWNRRFKHNRDKIKTGDIYELAEVVRNLAIREHQKGLSTGEKQMYTRAKKILASEMMYALDMDEEQVDASPHRRDPRGRRQRRAGNGRGGLTTKVVMAVALIVAAGRGERLGSGGPKALVTVAGRPMLEWSVAALREVDGVVADRRRAAGRAPRCRAGGRARRSPAGQRALSRCGRRWPRAAADDDVVIVHDAARALATPELFAAALRRARALGVDAVIAAAPVTDTIKQVGADGRTVERTLDRSRLWAVQTPQVFRRAALQRALAARAGAARDGNRRRLAGRAPGRYRRGVARIA